MKNFRIMSNGIYMAPTHKIAIYDLRADLLPNLKISPWPHIWESPNGGRLKEISKLNSFQFCFQVISPIFNAEEESLPSPPPSPLTDSKLDDRVRAKKNLITFFSHFLNIICKFNYESVSAWINKRTFYKSNQIKLNQGPFKL